MSGLFSKVRNFFSATDEYNVAGDSMGDSITNVTDISQAGTEMRRTVPVSSTRRSSNTPRVELVVVSAKDYRNDEEMTNEIASALRSNKSVIANMADLNSKLRSRIIDFASGMIYMVDGRVDIIDEYVYMFSTRDLKVVTSNTKQQAGAHGADYDYSPAEPQRYRQRDQMKDDYI